MHAVHRELPGQAQMCPVVLGHDQDAAHLLVQAMDDARAAHPADAGKAGAAMRQERVDERAVRMPRCRMHDDPGGLDQHDQVLVLEDHLERHRLGARRGRRRGRHGEHEPLALFDPAGRLRYEAAGRSDPAVTDQGLEPRPGKLGHALREEGVETLACIVGTDVELRGLTRQGQWRA